MYNDTIKKVTSEYGVFQGDIVLIRVNSLPEEKVKSNRKILAEGETSGHHHIVDDCIQAWVVGPELYLEVPETTKDVGVHHQEHGMAVLLPGWYKLGKPQREYDGENERRILD